MAAICGGRTGVGGFRRARWPCLQAAEAATAAGYYAAGFVAYEAAAAFGLAVHPAGSPDYPLLCLGLYRPGNVRPVDWPRPGWGVPVRSVAGGRGPGGLCSRLSRLSKRTSLGERRTRSTTPFRCGPILGHAGAVCRPGKAQQERRLPQSRRGAMPLLWTPAGWPSALPRWSCFSRLDGSPAGFAADEGHGRSGIGPRLRMIAGVKGSSRPRTGAENVMIVT